MLDEMAPIHQELPNAYSRNTNDEAVCLAVLFFFYVLPGHTNIMTDKGFNLFAECAVRLPDVYICSLREKGVSLFPEGTIKYTYLAE